MAVPPDNPFAAPAPAPAPAPAGALNPYAAPRAAVADRNADGAAPLASRGQRLRAMIIDSLIYMVAGAVGGLLAATGSVRVGIGAGALVVIAILAWNAVLIARHGQTVGKKTVKIRMVRSDGSDASFSRLFFLRGLLVWILWSLPYIGGLFWLIDILCIFRDDRRCVHDMLADTKVIEADD